MLETNRPEVSKYIKAQERPNSPEKIQVTRVIFEIGRHDDKLAAQTGQSDNEVSLTDIGAEHAMATAPNLHLYEGDQVLGSPALRAGQTAILHALGFAALSERPDQEDLTPPLITQHPTYAKLQQFMGDNFQVRDELGYRFGDGEYKKRLLAAAGQKKLAEYIYRESDQDKAEFGENIYAYSDFAANVAKVIKEGLLYTGYNFQQDKNPTADVELNEKWVYCGSHGGITESFLLKVVGKTAALKETDPKKAVDAQKQAQEELLEVWDGNGFGFSESIRVEVFDFGTIQDEQLRVRYQNQAKNYTFDQIVPVEILDEIIAERVPTPEQNMDKLLEVLDQKTVDYPTVIELAKTIIDRDGTEWVKDFMLAIGTRPAMIPLIMDEGTNRVPIDANSTPSEKLDGIIQHIQDAIDHKGMDYAKEANIKNKAEVVQLQQELEAGNLESVIAYFRENQDRVLKRMAENMFALKNGVMATFGIDRGSYMKGRYGRDLVEGASAYLVYKKALADLTTTTA
jgi:hypothetical protein